MKLTITQYPLEKIKPVQVSLKHHPERQIKQIAESIKAYGFNDPIAVDEHGEIIEGVGRYMAAQLLKLKSIPVIQLEHLSETQKRAYRITHNKICLNTDFNLDALRFELESLAQLDDSLLICIGFETAELEDLLKRPLLPELGEELIESLSGKKKITCPHCGGEIYA
jgi:ParB family transcriptional regulator, chromosome partitioning protein